RSASVSNIRNRAPGSVAKALATGHAASVRSHAKPAPAPMKTFAVIRSPSCRRPYGGVFTVSNDAGPLRLVSDRAPVLGQILLTLMSGSGTKLLIPNVCYFAALGGMSGRVEDIVHDPTRENCSNW